MARAELAKLPIVVTDAGRVGCLRVLQIAVGSPLTAFGIYGAATGDGSGWGTLGIAILLLGGAELIRYWYRRTVPPERYEITADAVGYSGIGGSWVEPLSAYSGVFWRQRTPSRLSGGQQVEWRVELRHATDRTRTVVLLESGLSANRERDRAAWRAAMVALALPGE